MKKRSLFLVTSLFLGIAAFICASMLYAFQCTPQPYAKYISENHKRCTYYCKNHGGCEDHGQDSGYCDWPGFCFATWYWYCIDGYNGIYQSNGPDVDSCGM